MKTPNNNIFSLIKSMSPAEKRYFKRHYASDKNRLTDLFDAINSQKKYDESTIRKTFSDSKLEKNLKVYKIQLSDLVLKSLSSFSYKEGATNKVQDNLKEVDLLFSRRLFKMGLAKTKKLKQFCLDKAQHFALPSVLLKEQAHQANFNLHDAEITTLKEIKRHLHQNSLFIDNKIKLAELNRKLQYKISWATNEQDRPFFENILTALEVHQYTSFHLDNYLVLLIKAKCQHCLGATDKALSLYQKLVNEYFNTIHKTSIPVNYFIQTFTGIAKIEINQRNFQSAKKAIDQITVMAQQHNLTEAILPTIHSLRCNLLVEKDSQENLKKNLTIFLDKISVYHLEKQPSILVALLTYASYLIRLEEYTIARSLLVKCQKNNSAAPTIFKQLTNVLDIMNQYWSTKNNHLSFDKEKKIKNNNPVTNQFYAELMAFFNDLNKVSTDQHPHLARSFKKLLHFYNGNELLNTLNILGFTNWIDQIQTSSILITTK